MSGRKYPVYPKHDAAICFNCGAELTGGTYQASGHAKDNGEWRQQCGATTRSGVVRGCGMVTYYDVREGAGRMRFAATFVARDGLRTLVRSAQGRDMEDTRKEAEEWLRGFLSSNAEDRLADIYGKQAIGTFRVDLFECWESGDPKGIYADE